MVVMHLAIQALSLVRHATETKETNISNKSNIVKNPKFKFDLTMNAQENPISI